MGLTTLFQLLRGAGEAEEEASCAGLIWFEAAEGQVVSVPTASCLCHSALACGRQSRKWRSSSPVPAELPHVVPSTHPCFTIVHRAQQPGGPGDRPQ